MLVAGVAHRHDAQQVAVTDGGGAVVDLAVALNGQTHEGQHVRADRELHQLLQRQNGAAQQRVPVEQIAAGRARERELRQHQQLHAVIGALLDDFAELLGVVHRVGDAQCGRSRRDLHKTMLH